MLEYFNKSCSAQNFMKRIIPAIQLQNYHIIEIILPITIKLLVNHGSVNKLLQLFIQLPMLVLLETVFILTYALPRLHVAL